MSPGDLQQNLARERLRSRTAFGAVMGIGGVSVIIAILLIFIPPLHRTAPFQRGPITAATRVASAVHQAPSVVALDEYAGIAFMVERDGAYRFVAGTDGTVLDDGHLLGAGEPAALVVAGDPAERSVIAGTRAGQVVLARAQYTVSYPDDRRTVTPSLQYPFGRAPLDVAGDGTALRLLAGQANDDQASVAAVTADGRLVLYAIVRETSFLDDEETLASSTATLDVDGNNVAHLLMDVEQRELYTISTDGVLSYFDISDKRQPVLVDRTAVTTPGGRATALAFLSGGLSLLVGDDRGRLTQWFPVRDVNNVYTLTRMRELPAMPGAITHIVPEHYRKGFLAIDADGRLGLYHATAARRLALEASAARATVAAAFAPRADAIVLAAADGELWWHDVHNPHPEVSWRALWGKVWYESREQPEYIWQSSSASAEFEPKFSLTPLTFGTFKASFYSMLFAVPIAVFGAIYTAYFMSAPMRAVVKPAIEVMAALPTVILGFLAGLWLAPLVERELIGIALSLFALPAAIMLAALAWFRLPTPWRRLVPDGWEALLLIPVLCLTVWFSFACGERAALWFDGSVTHWLSTVHGMPTTSAIRSWSVSPSASPSSPPSSRSARTPCSACRSLTMGSLALGATPWQTAVKVVLLTASRASSPPS